MKTEKKYLIDKWTDWSHTLSEAIENFYLNFSLYPNILEANNHTYTQFDFLINEIPSEKQKVYKLNDLTNKIQKPEDKEYIGISGFQTIKASVDFAINNKLTDKEFQLIYDSDPDWENDDVVNDLPDEEVEKLMV